MGARSSVRIRPTTPEDRADVDAFVVDRWGSDRMVAHGWLFHPADLPGFVAVDGDHAGDDGGTSVLGFLAYDVWDGACEVAMIDVARQREGRINLLLVDGMPPTDGQQVELVLTAFHFTPA